MGITDRNSQKHVTGELKNEASDLVCSMAPSCRFAFSSVVEQIPEQFGFAASFEANEADKDFASAPIFFGVRQHDRSAMLDEFWVLCIRVCTEFVFGFQYAQEGLRGGQDVVSFCDFSGGV